MADVSARLYNWSTNEASNSPGGSTTIGAGLDDNLRQIQATIRAELAKKGSDIASAATTDLGATAGSAHDITGTTTITGFGTVDSGIWKVLQFNSTCTVKHNASSLILPSAGDITAVPTDCLYAFSLGSGNWRVPFFGRGDGTPIGFINELTAETAIATGDYFPIYDVSASARRKMTYSDLMKGINVLTTDSTPAPSGDYVVTYDASALGPKKVLLDTLLRDAHGQVYLSYTSATAITLSPRGGRGLIINGSMYNVPTAGVVSSNPTAAANYVNAVAGQTLSASTVYDVYVFDNSGTLTFDFFNTSSHVTDTTGVEILNGSPSRTYVGKVYTNSSSNFQSVAAGVTASGAVGVCGVISWFNRRQLSVHTGLSVSVNAPATYTTWGNVGAGGNDMYATFLTFGDEAVHISSSGTVDNLSAGANTYVSIGLNSTTTAQDVWQQVSCPTAGNGYPYSISLSVKPAEGVYACYLLGAESGGIGQWVGSATTGRRCTLNLLISG